MFFNYLSSNKKKSNILIQVKFRLYSLQKFLKFKIAGRDRGMLKLIIEQQYYFWNTNGRIQKI